MAHLKHIPFYRITTPKAPMFTIEEERGAMSAFGNARNPRKKDIPSPSSISHLGSSKAGRKGKKVLDEDVNPYEGHNGKYLGAPHPEDDDIYILPFENYTKMTMKSYVDLMTTK